MADNNPQSEIRNPKSRFLLTLTPDSNLPTVHLFTDGACSGNPGPGGWAFILRHPASGKELERSGGEPVTTNNRMELTAAVRGLEALKSRSHVELFTDSVYVGKGISEWLPKWKANGWRRKERNKLVPIANEDLWRKLDAASRQAPGEVHARRRPQRPRGKRPRRPTGRGGVSAVFVARRPEDDLSVGRQADSLPRLILDDSRQCMRRRTMTA